MKTYLITGGAGFFGSILKKYLLKKGYRVVSVDLIHDSFKYKNFTAYQGDICNQSLMKKLCCQYNFDGIFHCAALLAHVRKDIKKLWHSNVEGTQSISNLCSEFGIKKVVFTSTNCLYSKSYDTPVLEEEPVHPTEIYGRSKLEGEKILLNNPNIHAVIFRCPTIMDEGRLGLLGILFSFIEENRKLWIVGNGKNKYQFIYAKDLANACCLALKYHKTDIFNIGSDHVDDFNTIYQYVIQKSHSKSKLVHLPKTLAIWGMKVCYWLGISPLGPYQYKMIASSFVFDTTKIKEKLGFIPTLTNKEMLLTAYSYYSKNKEEIKNRKNVSAHSQVAKMGIIRLIKKLS